MLLQAYDFLTLYDRHDCLLQMGGSDQWGNITAGVDLIRRVRGVSAHALVTPLITTASGAKFGKTEAGAVWLDADKTSPFQSLPVLAEHGGRGCSSVHEVLYAPSSGRGQRV